MRDIAEILHGIRPEFDFSTSDDFMRDGMLDSFDMVVLIDEIEKEFGISVDGLDVVPGNFKNVASIEALIEKTKRPA